MARRGRLALNKEVQEIICKSIRAGNHLVVAAQAAGITHQTLDRWLKKGREQKSGIYVQFVQEVKKAEAEAEQHAVAIIRKAMGEKWQSAAWWLERKRPERWAKREYVESKNIDITEMDEIARKAKDDPKVLEALIELQQRLDACEGDSGRPGKTGE